MAIKDEAKCQCDVPEPTGPWIFGARKCAKCGKVANWRELEK